MLRSENLMAKKTEIRRCIECPHCVDIGFGIPSDYKCNYDNNTRAVYNPLIIQDWCQLEDWKE